MAADGARPTGDELDAFCRDRLASYKVPRSWHFRSELSQTASGKIQKVVLREKYLADLAGGTAGAGRTSSG